MLAVVAPAAGRTRPQSETFVALVRRTASGRRKPSKEGLCLPAAVNRPVSKPG